MNKSVFFALLAAALFGASTPFAKWLTGDMSPVLLAGLLYLGSGLGLTLIRLGRDAGFKRPNLPPSEWPWLLGAVLFGGVLGPVALMFGLTSTPGASASLLLNLEAVLTSVMAWLVFKENADRRIVLGMAAIVAGGVVLAASGETSTVSAGLGPWLVAAACLCWAIDNNLTRKVSASDALFIAALKGLIAGGVNTLLAFSLGAQLPALVTLLATMLLGLLGYGVSLVLFVLALRGLGAARAGAYFSTAPFLGAAVAVLVFGESVSMTFGVAAALMGLGVWLHLTERHAHHHQHDAQDHTHRHSHDEHHQHPHDFAWDEKGPHQHPHAHEAVSHSHAHYPDTEHRHRH